MATRGECLGLVRNALTARYMTGAGCFRSNESCGLLRQLGESALPTIEAALLEEVLPFYHCPTESLDRTFPGLLSLLVTYFAIGKDSGSTRVFSFFRHLHGSLRVEAMWAINVVWLARAPVTAAPEPRLEAVRELAKEGTGKVQEVARWFLDRAGETRGPEAG
jgi:hypothetical protein